MINGNGTGDKLGMVDFSHKTPAAEEDATNTKKKQAPPSWTEAWVEFSRNTTIHGLRFIWMEHAFLFRRLLWFVLVTVCATLMGIQIVERIIYYYKHPTTVNVNVNFNKSLMFPSLTICNQNAFR
nr:hypothetical protein BaRGS_031225 [Batillaria attramentaria]